MDSYSFAHLTFLLAGAMLVAAAGITGLWSWLQYQAARALKRSSDPATRYSLIRMVSRARRRSRRGMLMTLGLGAVIVVNLQIVRGPGV